MNVDPRHGPEGTRVHSLLLDVSSGLPPAGPTVDLLISLGRRRQRVIVSGVAGGTVAVVAAGAVMAAQAAPSTKSSGNGNAATSATASTTAPVAAPATSAPPVSRRTTPAQMSTAAAPVVTAPAGFVLGPQVPVYSAQVLDGGSRVWAQVYTRNSCDAHPLLRATETATEVRLSIYLSAPGAPNAKDKPSCQPDWIVKPPGVITATNDAGGSYVALASPLGHRRILDAVSGAQVPYTDASVVRPPTWIPPGFAQVGEFTPLNGHWVLEYDTTPRQSDTHYQQLVVIEQPNGPKDLGQPANATVDGHEAWYGDYAGTHQLDWFADGMRLSVIDDSTTVDPCLTSESKARQVAAQCDVLVPAAVTRTQMFKVANSIR